jgi:hypothetical protein
MGREHLIWTLSPGSLRRNPLMAMFFDFSGCSTLLSSEVLAPGRWFRRDSMGSLTIAAWTGGTPTCDSRPRLRKTSGIASKREIEERPTEADFLRSRSAFCLRARPELRASVRHTSVDVTDARYGQVLNEKQPSANQCAGVLRLSSRSDRTAIELFVAGVLTWDAFLLEILPR